MATGSGGAMDGEPLDDVRVEWARLVGVLWGTGHPGAELLRPVARTTSPDFVSDTGGDWPDELVFWFEQQNGADADMRAAVLDGRVPLGLAEAESHWAIVLEAAAAWDDEERSAAADSRAGQDILVFGTRLVPIAWDGATGYLVVDLRPGRLRGSVVFFDPEIGTTYFGGESDISIAALVRRCRLALENPAGYELLNDQGGLEVAFGRAPQGTVDDWEEWDGPSSPTPFPWSPGWSWPLVAWTIAEFGFFHDPRTLAVIGPSFDYLLTLDDDELLAATATEPEEIGHVAVNSLLAACVDHACRVRGVEPPAWTSGRDRRMSESFEVADLPSAELRRLRETPEAFRVHGIALTWTPPTA